MRAVMFVGCALVVLLIGPAGCQMGPSDIPKLGKVTGVVTLDGEPLPNARVQFIPENSRMSFGQTDGEGRYTLMFNDPLAGAAVGKHKIRIMAAGSPEEPETLPPKYNFQTELTAEVSEGDNEIDFELKSN